MKNVSLFVSLSLVITALFSCNQPDFENRNTNFDNPKKERREVYTENDLDKYKLKKDSTKTNKTPKVLRGRDFYDTYVELLESELFKMGLDGTRYKFEKFDELGKEQRGVVDSIYNLILVNNAHLLKEGLQQSK